MLQRSASLARNLGLRSTVSPRRGLNKLIKYEYQIKAIDSNDPRCKLFGRLKFKSKDQDINIEASDYYCSLRG